MDYEKLADEFMQMMFKLRHLKPQQKISESLHGETFVLQFVALRGDNVIPSEISGEMGISTARVAAALNGLESKGMITRSIDSSDRRRVLVALTSEGRELAKSQKQALISSVARMFSALGEEDAREYVRITQRLTELAPKYCE